MGSSSSQPSKNFCLSTSKGDELKCVAQACGLQNAHLQRFYKVFRTVDVDERGVIYRHEFFVFLNVSKTGFAKRAFALMDQNTDNRVDFIEFVAVIFTYCTYNFSALCRFAFDLFDVDGSGELGADEIRRLVEFVYGEGLSLKVSRILDHLDADGSGNVDFGEFALLNKDYPQLLFPAFYLQEVMRQKCLGNMFWEDHTERTNKAFKNRQLPLRSVLEGISAAFQNDDVPDMGTLLAKGERKRGVASKARAFVKQKSKELEEAVKRTRRQKNDLDLSKKKDGIFQHAEKYSTSFEKVRRRREEKKKRKQLQAEVGAAGRNPKAATIVSRAQAAAKREEGPVQEKASTRGFMRLVSVKRAPAKVEGATSKTNSSPDREPVQILSSPNKKKIVPSSLSTSSAATGRPAAMPKKTLPRTMPSSDPMSKAVATFTSAAAKSEGPQAVPRSNKALPRTKSAPTMGARKHAMPGSAQSSYSPSSSLSSATTTLSGKKTSASLTTASSGDTAASKATAASRKPLPRAIISEGKAKAASSNSGKVLTAAATAAAAPPPQKNSGGLPRTRSAPTMTPKRIVTVDSTAQSVAAPQKRWNCSHCGSLNDDMAVDVCCMCGIRGSTGFSAGTWGPLLSISDDFPPHGTVDHGMSQDVVITIIP